MRYLIALALLFGACESPHRIARTVEGLARLKEWPASRILQGAQPEGEVAFRNLAALGVTTVLSVDGAAPDVEGAQRHGLAYFHVPIGYDGIARDKALQIIKAVRDAKGKVYMHCHHGRHRGPTAVMVSRIALDGISNEDAVRCMEESGTSPKYVGLYRDVRAFKVPTEAEIDAAPTAPSKVVPEGVRAAMVGVSHRFEFLKKSKSQNWKVLADSPDVSPPHEARMLWELFREAARLDEAKQKGPDFRIFLRQGEDAAVSLEKALRAADHTEATKAYKRVKASCNACHAEFRN